MHVFREFVDFHSGSEMQIEALLYELIGGAARLAEMGTIDDSWIGTAVEFFSTQLLGTHIGHSADCGSRAG